MALDDFGTGYSSLASLAQLPITRVKLDRTLIEGIDRSPRSAAIARSVIALCHGLGLEVVAEGVERPGQLATAWRSADRSRCRASCWPTPVEMQIAPQTAEAAAAKARPCCWRRRGSRDADSTRADGWVAGVRRRQVAAGGP